MLVLKVITIVLLWSKRTLCEMSGFIVGGYLASINEFPHSAFLRIDSVTSTGQLQHWQCGSSIINQRVLLTAAHCLEEVKKILVSLGSEDRDLGLTIKAGSYIKHENYNPWTLQSDLGLVGLSKPLRFTSKIRRVALMKNPPYKEKAFVAGWGVVDENSERVFPMLKYLDQSVRNPNRCYKENYKIVPGTICASSAKTSEFPAVGDSGCALILRGYIQIGVVSHKIPVRAPNVIIYTDVGYYYDWIKHNAKRIFCFYKLNT